MGSHIAMYGQKIFSGGRIRTGWENMVYYYYYYYCSKKLRNMKKREDNFHLRGCSKLRLQNHDAGYASPAHGKSNVLKNSSGVSDFPSSCHNESNKFFSIVNGNFVYQRLDVTRDEVVKASEVP